MKRTSLKALLLGLCLALFLSAGDSTLQTEIISQEMLTSYPVPVDSRNYFFLQSIGDSTSIVIGDFSAGEKLIVLIIDQNCDNTVDKVIEYFPESKKKRVLKTSSSKFFKTNLEELKKDIITGKIFEENYSYKMGSLGTLNQKLKEGFDIFPHETGFNVKIYDPDLPTTIMHEYFFGKKLGRYNLIFRTSYYKILKTRVSPVLEYSVLCKNTKDPVVAQVVEDLVKLAPMK